MYVCKLLFAVQSGHCDGIGKCKASGPNDALMHSCTYTCNMHALQESSNRPNWQWRKMDLLPRKKGSDQAWFLFTYFHFHFLCSPEESPNVSAYTYVHTYTYIMCIRTYICTYITVYIMMLILLKGMLLGSSFELLSSHCWHC